MVTSIQLLGCDGSTWDLTSGADGATLAGGISGLHLPKVTHLWTKTAHRSGQTWRGSRLESRSFSMQILVGDTAPPFRIGSDWLALDDEFWSALSTEATAQLVVNGARTLTFRLDDGNDQEALSTDPSLAGCAVYTIDCVADRPEWAGAPIAASFPYQASSSSNFFGGGSGALGPPFYISAASGLDTASVANPGDLPAYPVWTITGPVGSATVGVVGQTVTLPFPLLAGDQVIIDTEAQTISDPQGTNLWPQMGYADVEFAPIPAGGTAPVVVGMSGADVGASVAVSLTPLYRRAW
jgi:hypothetical protein